MTLFNYLQKTEKSQILMTFFKYGGRPRRREKIEHTNIKN